MRSLFGNGTDLRRLISRGLGCILLGILLLLDPAVCDEPQPYGSASGEAERSATTILVHSDLVLIPVTVTDGKGRIVTGLEKEHFTLYEDKVAQVISQFDTEDNPVSIGLVF